MRTRFALLAATALVLVAPSASAQLQRLATASACQLIGGACIGSTGPAGTPQAGLKLVWGDNYSRPYSTEFITTTNPYGIWGTQFTYNGLQGVHGVTTGGNGTDNGGMVAADYEGYVDLTLPGSDALNGATPNWPNNIIYSTGSLQLEARAATTTEQQMMPPQDGVSSLRPLVTPGINLGSSLAWFLGPNHSIFFENNAAMTATGVGPRGAHPSYMFYIGIANYSFCVRDAIELEANSLVALFTGNTNFNCVASTGPGGTAVNHSGGYAANGILQKNLAKWTQTIEGASVQTSVAASTLIGNPQTTTVTDFAGGFNGETFTLTDWTTGGKTFFVSSHYVRLWIDPADPFYVPGVADPAPTLVDYAGSATYTLPALATLWPGASGGAEYVEADPVDDDEPGMGHFSNYQRTDTRLTGATITGNTLVGTIASGTPADSMLVYGANSDVRQSTLITSCSNVAGTATCTVDGAPQTVASENMNLVTLFPPGMTYRSGTRTITYDPGSGDPTGHAGRILIPVFYLSPDSAGTSYKIVFYRGPKCFPINAYDAADLYSWCDTGSAGILPGNASPKGIVTTGNLASLNATFNATTGFLTSTVGASGNVAATVNATNSQGQTGTPQSFTFTETQWASISPSAWYDTSDDSAVDVRRGLISTLADRVGNASMTAPTTIGGFALTGQPNRKPGTAGPLTYLPTTAFTGTSTAATVMSVPTNAPASTCLQSTASGSNPHDFTMFAVFSATSAVNGNVMAVSEAPSTGSAGDSNGASIVRVSGSASFVRLRSVSTNVNISLPTIAINTPTAVLWVYASGKSTVYVNSTSPCAGCNAATHNKPTGAWGTGLQLTLGNLFTKAGWNASPFIGNIYEAGFACSAISGAQAVQEMTDLDAKWSLGF